METVLLIIMGILGIALYSAFKAKTFLAEDTFSLSVFFKNNLKIWIWSTIVIILMAVILFIEPNANETIKSLSGLDLVNTKTGWLLFGAGLCGLIRNAKK